MNIFGHEQQSLMITGYGPETMKKRSPRIIRVTLIFLFFIICGLIFTAGPHDAAASPETMKILSVNVLCKSVAKYFHSSAVTNGKIVRCEREKPC